MKKIISTRNSSLWRKLAFAAFTLAVVVGLSHYQLQGKYLQSTDNAYIRAEFVIVAPKVSGYVERVLVSANQSVKAGDPLVQIDASDYEAKAAQAQAQIAVANALADNIHAQIREQRAIIDQARAILAAAKSEAHFSATETARYQQLMKAGAGTRQQQSQLDNRMRKAQSQLISRRAAVKSAKRRLASLEAAAGQALAQAKAAEAKLQAANLNVAATLIKASIDGRIGDASVRIGQYAQPGMRLMTVVPSQKLYVEANFKETQVGLMREGQAVSLAVDAFPNILLPGRVQSFSPATGALFSILPPQNATGNFTKIVQRIPVRISIDINTEALELLTPGMSVAVEVDTSTARHESEKLSQMIRNMPRIDAHHASTQIISAVGPADAASRLSP